MGHNKQTLYTDVKSANSLTRKVQLAITTHIIQFEGHCST